MPSISSVSAISRLSTVRTVAARRRTSSSWMCRRSSRRCAVTPSAPARSHASAAATGSGSSVRRACLIVATVLILAACGPTNTGPLTGAPAPRTAVEQFLAAIRAQDLQALSIIWGTEKGPTRDLIERRELEKRELIMQCMLAHDRFRILNEGPGQAGKRVFRVELTRGPITRATNFTATQGPSERWYVESADLEPVKDLCRNMPTG